MLEFDPTLIVQRLIVYRGDAAVYDEQFHEGVNVLRGENSSGKSTVMNFIFYGLGGDLADWSETALLCDRVVVAAEFNSKPVVLSRAVSRSIGQPMEIYGGTFNASLSADRSEWARYPYKRSESMESFSQAIFRLLNLPEVANEVSGNLTLHQVFRLLYADQLSPVESLFRFERFDQPALRDAVGRLLCGANDTEIYQIEIQLRSLDKELSTVTAEVGSLLAVLSNEKHALTLDWVRAEKAQLEHRRTAIEAEIGKKEIERSSALKQDEISLEAQNNAYARARELQVVLGQQQATRDALEFTVADSARFISDLEARMTSLSDVDLVAEEIGAITFGLCPVCYAPIEHEIGHEKHEDECHLCKSPFQSQRGRERIASIINDLGRQLKQSETLQRKRHRDLSALKADITKTEAEWREAARELASLRRMPSTEAQAALSKLQQALGYISRESEDLDRKERYIAIVDQLSKRRDALNLQMERLRHRSDVLKGSQRQSLFVAYTAIADEVRYLLKSDLPRQDTFANPQSIGFDFITNKISVDGHSYFSASSRVILKSSFYMGFLAAAAKSRQFRHPRFCMLDTIEDKGMEQARSHNFQNLILRVSEGLQARHQIIFATAMISPALDKPDYTIGRASSLARPTLAIAV